MKTSETNENIYKPPKEMRSDFNFNKVSKFVKTLYRLVSDERFKEIGWTENGKGFRIYDKENFMKNVLPYLSKTREYSAFLRQLHLYGFVKIKTSSTTYEEYFHNSFQKDREDILFCVKHNKDKTLSVYEDKARLVENARSYQEAFEFINRKNHALENEVCILKERLDKQENTIDGLVELLSRMLKISKVEVNTLKLIGEQNRLENLKLTHDGDKFQLAIPQDLGKYALNTVNNSKDQEMYKLARNNFETSTFLKGRADNLPHNNNKLECYKASREEIFGNSDESCEGTYIDDYF